MYVVISTMYVVRMIRMGPFTLCKLFSNYKIKVVLVSLLRYMYTAAYCATKMTTSSLVSSCYLCDTSFNYPGTYSNCINS